MENITETVMNEATPVIEATVDTIVQVIPQPKPMGAGKKTLVTMLVATVIGIGGYCGYKLHAKHKANKAKEQSDAQGYDNVDIAKRDFLDDPADETCEEA